MAAHSTVGIDDDLAPGEAGIPLRPADDDPAGGIDQEFRLVGQQFRRQLLANDFADEEIAKLLVLHFRGVLRGNDHIRDADHVEALINHRDLRLRIGPQPADLAALADAGQSAPQSMGKHDRRRHEFRRLVTGVTKHQSLVARTLLGVALAFGRGGVHALSDVRRLRGDDVLDENAVRVKDVVIVHVADLANGIAHDLDVVELGLGGDFTADDDDITLGVGLAGDTAVLVLTDAGIEHGVGDGVTDFVGVTFTDGLGGKNETTGHSRNNG